MSALPVDLPGVSALTENRIESADGSGVLQIVGEAGPLERFADFDVFPEVVGENAPVNVAGLVPYADAPRSQAVVPSTLGSRDQRLKNLLDSGVEISPSMLRDVFGLHDFPLDVVGRYLPQYLAKIGGAA